MIGNRKSKLTAVVSTLLAGVFLMSACSVNMNGVGKAFSDLGEDLSEARSNRASARQEETQPAETEVAETSIEETETAETTEVTPEPTATPVPTATPTPSPTPVPQRVDFSDLTTDALTNDIDIKIEEFAESAHAEDDDDIVLAVFEGERVLIESEEDLASAVSVNLMLDAFYMEAEGIYNRVVNEQYAAYDLDPETVPPTKEVTVDYEYFFNGRLLCIVMNYSVTQEEEVLITSTEYYRFDLYTGQIINSDMLVNDVDAFYDGLAEAVAESTSSRTDKAEDYHVEFFSIETNEDGETEVIAAVTSDDGFEVKADESGANLRYQNFQGNEWYYTCTTLNVNETLGKQNIVSLRNVGDLDGDAYLILFEDGLTILMWISEKNETLNSIWTSHLDEDEILRIAKSCR